MNYRLSAQLVAPNEIKWCPRNVCQVNAKGALKCGLGTDFSEKAREFAQSGRANLPSTEIAWISSRSACCRR
jgi:hypothetical protein